MGSPSASILQMRLQWAVIVLLQLLLFPSVASSTGRNGVVRATSTVPVSIMNMTGEKDAAVGHCGIIFAGASAAQQIGQNKQRQACFALQSYGFLTRYMKHEQSEMPSWGNDVCLLLAFCGNECHRLYGHPQKTAAATNALTEAEASITGKAANNQTEIKTMPYLSGGKPIANRSSDGSAIQSYSQADGMQLSGAPHTRGDAVSPGSQSSSLQLSDSQHSDSYRTKKSCKNCAKHFMSHAWRARCKGVYSLEFEALNQGFGRFLARLALLIGAADIEEVVDIERELQEYIRLKQMRALKAQTSRPEEASAPAQPSQQSTRSNDIFKSAPLLESQEGALVPANASYASTGTSGLLDHELRILLEPLFSNNELASSRENAKFEPVPTIQISIPPSFRARFAPIPTHGSSMAPTRRLRGTSAGDSANLEAWVGHKPFPAGSTLSSVGHCRAAAALMSQRSELQWLKEYIFFLPHRG